MHTHLTARSSNRKTGKIPVSTTAAKSCPDTCPLKGTECYGEGFHIKMHWNKVSSEERGTDWPGFIEQIEKLPLGQKWRHNQVGDLYGENQFIDPVKLEELVKANKGKRGWTYTHKPLERFKNFQKVKSANDGGFTVNVSSNTIQEAEKYYSAGLPTVAVVPENYPEKSITPQGIRMVVCPAQTGKAKDCEACMLCQNSKRKLIVAFRDHSPGKQKIDFTAFWEYMNAKAAA